ncbi:L,D-transpeptidase family protein [Shigella flexneri]
MGLYAIYIGRSYAIHGTNANFGIGLRVSQGCIRLRNDDIKYLFDNVPVGTRVQIIHQPVKYTTNQMARTGWKFMSRCRESCRI